MFVTVRSLACLHLLESTQNQELSIVYGYKSDMNRSCNECAFTESASLNACIH